MVNDSYVKAASMIKSAFDRDGSVELKLFLGPARYPAFKNKNLSIKTKEVFEPLTCKHSIANTTVNENISEFIKKIVGKKPTNWQLWSFSQGNYTVINDEALEKPGIDIIIDITENWSAEFGGAIVYVDGSGESTQIDAEGNKLILVKRKKGEHRFVQYVNHLAKKNKRVFLISRI